MVTVSGFQPQGLRRSVRVTSIHNGLAGFVWATAALALTAAVVGLVVDGVYIGARSTAEILRGDDVVTAFIVVPGLCVAAAYTRRGSLQGRLVTAGLLADLVYSYAFYVFGTGFNDVFLLHVVVFSASLTALVLTLAGLDIDAVRERLGRVRRVRPVAAALGILALSLGGMWVSAAVANAANGTVPAGSALVETPAIIHLALVLDLAVQVPLYAAGAVLLWRRTGWGYLLAFVALLSGIPEQISYMFGMPLQVTAGVPDAVSFDPLEPVILAFYVIGFVLLLRDVRAVRVDEPGAGGRGLGR